MGLAALSSGVTSMAAASRAFAGYFVDQVAPLPMTLVVILFCLLIAGVVMRGIRESMWMNLLCTGIEVAGLLFVIAVGVRFLGGIDYFDATSAANPAGDFGYSVILSGAVMLFFSFVGWGDIVV